MRFLRRPLFVHMFVLNYNMSTGLLNEGLGDGGEERQAGKRLPKPIRGQAQDEGLGSATISALIEVRVVNLVAN